MREKRREQRMRNKRENTKVTEEVGAPWWTKHTQPPTKGLKLMKDPCQSRYTP